MFADEGADDEALEGAEGDDAVTIKVPRQRASRNGASGSKATGPSVEALAAFRSAITTTARELNVTRVAGPGNKNVYRGRPVQCADCPDKLPPEAAENLVAAIKERWGGGVYRVWPDGAKANEVLYPIRVPGRPLPLDQAQALDDEAEAEEREAYGGAALPPVGGGYAGYAGVDPLTGARTLMAPMAAPPGMVYDPAMQRYVPMAPYAGAAYQDGNLKTLEKENEALKRQAELGPIQRELDELKKGGAGAGREGPFDAMIKMMQLKADEAEKERKWILQREADDRKAREAAEEKRLTAEKDRYEKRLDEEREERKERAQAEKDRLERERERDREDRIEREKERQAMFGMVVKLMTEGATKRDPMEMLDKVLGVAQGVKDLHAPAPKSEVAEITEAVTAGSKEVIGALGDAFRGRSSGDAANPPPKDEKVQALDVLDYMTGLAKNGIAPRDAFTAVVAFCAGRGYDTNKILGRIKTYADPAVVEKLRAELAEYSTSSLVPEKVRAQTKDASDLLAQEQNVRWLLEVGTIAAK